MANPVTHFEIQGADGPQLQQFYRDTLGWDVDSNNPMNYGMVSQQGGRGIGGGITAMQPGDSARVTVYVEVPDLAATLQQVAKAGGTVMMEPMEVPGTQNGLVIAMFSDPAGNVIGLAKEGTM